MRAIVKDRNPFNIVPENYFSEVQEVRVLFSKIINCEATNIALIPSTSYGFSSVLNNIIGKTNGHAITIKEEFPSGYFSLKKWCETNQNDLIIIEPDTNQSQIGENWNTRILNQINTNTSVVLISSVHWMNGLKFDLEKIGEKCRANGVKFIVDGTQSTGAIRMDVKAYKIDALICAGYKWLFGPYSTGLMYISDEFENGTPLEESWMNRANAKDFSNLTNYEDNYSAGAGKYNVGQTSNLILMPILKEALKQINLWTVESIESYCKNLIQPLIKYLTRLGVVLENEDYFSSHLFSLKLPPSINIDKLKENLTNHNIYISIRGEYIRVSVNVFNDTADINKLIEVIEMTRE